MTESLEEQGRRIADSTGDGPRDRTDAGLMSRRKFAAVGGSTLAWASCTAARTEVEATDSDAPSRRGHMLMVIDLRRCTGCHSCAVACKAEHGVRLGGFRSWVSEQEIGSYPDVTREFLPRLCNQCQNSPCLKVCPTGATSRRADGIIKVDPDRCIGCRHCMAACPYNARYFNPQRDLGGEQRRFPARTHGTVDKCDFCSRRVDAGQEPACVATCPASARAFGDAQDPASEVARMLVREPAITLLPNLGTRPSVVYIGGRPEAFERG
jgi:tetrathionate reductase subunit B